mgnify:CR=1 FL=1
MIDIMKYFSAILNLDVKIASRFDQIWIRPILKILGTVGAAAAVAPYC